MKKFLSLFMSAIMILSIFSALGVAPFAVSSEDFDYWVLSEADKTCTISNYSGSAAEITIPSQIDGYTVTEISSIAFFDCTSLTEINAETDNMYFSSLGGVLFNKTKTELVAYPLGNKRTSYKIPDGVTSIGEYAFCGCASLASITVPDSVTEFGWSAFAECTSLTSVNIPNRMTEIGSSAFEGCASLESITIPDGVEIIGSSAFDNCTSLTNVNITDSVKKIDDFAFSGCTSFANITVPDSVECIGMSAFTDTAYYNNQSNWENNVLYIGNHLIRARNALSGDYKIKDGTKTIAVTAFAFAQLTSVTIPDSVTSISNGAFECCSLLASVTIPDSVTDISSDAFIDCTSLTSVNIPEGVISIDSSAFEGCSSLTSVTLPNSLASIGDYAFMDCPSLTSITVSDSVTSIESGALGYLYDGSCLDVKKLDGFAIYGSKGSAAQSYANTNGFIFIPLDGIENVSMHRLYNPNSGEHFYTSDIKEKDNLISLGWTYEGIGWTAPEASLTPVYRLYNQSGGEHHYTTDANEKNNLISLGWNDEGIGWYSDEAKGVTVYRQYNPNAFANNHNYTTDKGENDYLITIGWKSEGIGWYGAA